MSNKHSSIEWLVEKIQQANPSFKFDALIRQALAMHKQEIIDAHGDEQSHLQDDGSWRTVTSEQYYNKTFGGNNEQQ